MAAQVALKRQQAAEDAIALGLRAISGEGVSMSYLPAGPVWGGVKEDGQETAMDEDDEEDLNIDSGGDTVVLF